MSEASVRGTWPAWRSGPKTVCSRRFQTVCGSGDAVNVNLMLLAKRDPAPSFRLAVHRWPEANAGDEAVQHGIAKCFGPSVEWVDVPLFSSAKEVAALAASCAGIVVGGGTILGNLPTWILRSELAQNVVDLPTCIFGTGIRDEGESRITPQFHESVSSLLARSLPVGVRGRLSRELLVRSGIDVTEVEVIGDPALALEAVNATKRRGVAINIRPRPNGQEATTIELVRRLLDSRAVDQLGPITLFSCHDHWDLRVEDELGVRVEPYQDLRTLMTLLAGSELVIAERLHGAVLGHVVGTPVVHLSYERKCLDYMDSVGRGELCLDSRDLDALLRACDRAHDVGVDPAPIELFRQRQHAHAMRFMERLQ